FGYAHAHLALERRQTALRRQRLRRAERPGVVFHRWHSETRARAHLPDKSDYEQLQAAGARVRSAGQSCLLRAQPFCRDPDSDLFAESESKTDRVPHARCGSESISRILRALARWARWNPEPPRSRRSAR